MRLSVRQIGPMLRSAAFASLVGVYLGVGVQFALRLYLARPLGTVHYGDVALALAIINVVAHLAMVGFNHALPRLVGEYQARGDDGRLYGAVRFAVMLTCGASAALAVLGASLAWGLGHDRPQRVTTLLLAFAVVPLLAMLHLMIHVARSFQRMWLARLPYNVILPTLVLTVVVALAVTDRLTPARVIAAYGLLAMPLILDVGRRLLRLPPLARARQGRPVHEPRPWMRLALPNLLFTGCNQLVRRMDLLLVGLLASDEELGVYALAFNLMQVVMLATHAANAYISSSLASAHAMGDRDRLRREARATARLALVMSGSLALLLVIAGQPILAFFGEAFVAGYPLLVVLLLGVVAEACFAPGMNLLQMADRERQAAAILAGLLVASTIGYIVLLPIHGAMGAAVVAAVTRLLIGYLSHRACRRNLNCSAAAI